MLSCLLSLLRSFVCVCPFCPPCVCALHSHASICWSELSVYIYLWLSCPLKHHPLYLETKRETLAPPFFTYGNSLSPTRLPTISYLVSHGLLCTSVRMQDGVRHLWETSEREEKEQLREVGGIISGFWSDASQSLIYFLHRGDVRWRFSALSSLRRSRNSLGWITATEYKHFQTVDFRFSTFLR